MVRRCLVSSIRVQEAISPPVTNQIWISAAIGWGVVLLWPIAMLGVFSRQLREITAQCKSFSIADLALLDGLWVAASLAK